MRNFRKYFFMVVISFAVPFLLFYTINFIFEEKINYKTVATTTSCNINTTETANNDIKRRNKSHFQNNEKISLNFYYNDLNWHFDENDFEYNGNIHTISQNIYKSNRHKGYHHKCTIAKKIKKMGFGEDVAIKYIFANIEDKLNSILLQIEKKPKNADVFYNKTLSQFVYQKEITGLMVDKQKLYKKIFDKLLISSKLDINIETEIIYPNITEENLKSKMKKQSTFSTNYSQSSFERKNNIKIATSSLNGYKIEPNEIFSFNDAIGKRLESKGYLKANIIKDGEFVKGTGGGVCQVSTTLYNALLLAGINVTETHKHSLPVSYVKPGFDAMVSWGTSDLKFKNTTKHPIIILSNCNGESIIFKIFGDTKDENTTIETFSQISNIIPHKPDKIIPDVSKKYADKIQYKGEFYQEKKGRDGYQVQAYLKYYVDGKLIKKVLIRECSYEPQQGIKYEGTKDTPPAIPFEQNESNT